MIEIVGFAIAMTIGWLAVNRLAPGRGFEPRWARIVFETALGAGAGIALTGSLYFVLAVLGLVSRWLILAIEIAPLGVLALLPRRGAAPDSPMTARPGWAGNPVLVGVLALALALVVAGQVDTIQASPYGQWDAFAMWNVRAQFLAGPPGAWENAVTPLIPHADYPPLLSAFIGRLWRLGGDAGTPPAPVATGLLLFWGVLALLAASLALLRATSAGLLACLVLVATVPYVGESVWQYADIPLSFYFVATLSLLALAAMAPDARRSRLWLAAGAFASSAALVKNEGIPFLLLALACPLVVGWWREGRTRAIARFRWMLMGGAPAIVILTVFKFALAPHIGPLRGQPAAQVFEKLADVDRYVAILSACGTVIVKLGNGLSHPLVLLAILAVALRFSIDAKMRPAVLASGLVLVLMIAAYWGVYLVTPVDLAWRLGVSLNRLFIQIWPSLLFVAFLVLNAPRGPLLGAAPASNKTEQKAKHRRLPALG